MLDLESQGEKSFIRMIIISLWAPLLRPSLIKDYQNPPPRSIILTKTNQPTRLASIGSGDNIGMKKGGRGEPLRPAWDAEKTILVRQSDLLRNNPVTGYCLSACTVLWGQRV